MFVVNFYNFLMSTKVYKQILFMSSEKTNKCFPVLFKCEVPPEKNPLNFAAVLFKLN